jgi:hypothetical protein
MPAASAPASGENRAAQPTAHSSSSTAGASAAAQGRPRPEGGQGEARQGGVLPCGANVVSVLQCCSVSVLQCCSVSVLQCRASAS